MEEEFTLKESQNIFLRQQNQEVAAQLVKLTNEIQARRAVALKKMNLSDRFKTLQANNETARNQLRVLKYVTGLIIAGSGIDWARDAQLRGLVTNVL